MTERAWPRETLLSLPPEPVLCKTEWVRECLLHLKVSPQHPDISEGCGCTSQETPQEGHSFGPNSWLNTPQQFPQQWGSVVAPPCHLVSPPEV